MSAQDDFQAMLNQTGLTLICPACEGTHWIVIRSDLIIPSASGSQYPVLLIECSGCGHQRFFSPTDPNGELRAE